MQMQRDSKEDTKLYLISAERPVGFSTSMQINENSEIKVHPRRLSSCFSPLLIMMCRSLTACSVYVIA